jgi:hypothetical protein
MVPTFGMTTARENPKTSASARHHEHRPVNELAA